MLPCTGFSSGFFMEKFYSYWKAMVCILFPLESISMYFISCAHKTRKKDKEVTQEPKYLVDSFPLKVTDQCLVQREIGCGMCLFQFRYTSGCCCANACILHAGPDGDDSSLRFWPASTSLGLNNNLFLFLHEHRKTILHCGS